MKRLTANESLAEIGLLRNMLERSGITCMVKNEQLSGGLGEIPFLDCLPELWVMDDEQLPRAQELVDELRTSASQATAWRCQCGEINEGQFVACWQCGEMDVTRA